MEVFSISLTFRGVLLTSVLRVLADWMIPDDNAYLELGSIFADCESHNPMRYSYDQLRSIHNNPFS